MMGLFEIIGFPGGGNIDGNRRKYNINKRMMIDR
jgi:hypothetical protein